MIEVDLLRHVKVAGKPALYGVSDVAPLAEENKRLLNILITQKKSINAYDKIITSPLIRCHELALAVSNYSQLPLTVSSAFKEVDFGIFDGVPFDDLYFNSSGIDKANEPLLCWSTLDSFFQAPADITLPQAEPLLTFHQRITKAWDRLVNELIVECLKTQSQRQCQSQSSQSKCESHSDEKSSSPLKNKRTLLVAHGGVIRMILAHVLKIDWQNPSWHQQLKVANGSLSSIVITPNISLKALHNKENNIDYHQQVTTIAMPLLAD